MEYIKPLPIGVEFYKDMVSEGYYYVDKTLLIRDILAQKSKVTLFTRPRRFGKTLAQSMLKTYFEKEILPDGTAVDNSVYFNGKKIMEAGEEYTKHMGQYPVIFLSLKSAKQPSYDIAYEKIRESVTNEFIRHRYVIEGDALLPLQKERYNLFMEQKARLPEYATSLLFLSDCLVQYHKQKAVILIDEYDVPLENAYFEGFYDKMVSFIRSLFESVLKTNKNLGFAVITGCLRISRESIFTGLNNLEVVLVLDENYAEYFGFVQDEIDDMLDAYGIQDRSDEVKQWYDGYFFGNTDVYNPWSLINYVKDIVYKNTNFPKPYWSNTSSNSIIRELVEKADDITRCELEELVAGGTIEKPVHEDITYADIYKSQDNLWNFLFFAGYLKKTGERWDEQLHRIYLYLAIPNKEISYIYHNIIIEWSDQRIQACDLSGLIKALDNGDCIAASDIITGQLLDTISFYNYKEDYYHRFLAGLLKNNTKYYLKSNRESGFGRYDLVLKTHRIRNGRAIILEFKTAGSISEMENGCKKALEQIEELHYDSDIINEGYTDIIKYGVCFYKKECLVMMGR